MLQKYISLKLLLYLIALVIISFTACYTLLLLNAIVLSIILIIVIIILVIAIIAKFNSINNKLAYFFESIENEDSQLRFPINIKNNSMRRLHESLNRVNQIIGVSKLNNERNERYFSELIQHSATGLMTLNSNQNVEIINHKACELLGIEHGHNIILLKTQNAELWDTLCTIRSGNTITYKYFRNGLFRHLSIRATEMIFQNSKTKLISIQDIKQELDTLELEAWQKLISILTHEMMNSIAPITSLTATLRKFFENKSSEISHDTIANTVKGLDIIEERGKGLMEFVNNYRKLTKIPNPVFQSFSAHNWLNKIKILLNNQLHTHNITLDISVDTKADEFIADETLMTQVVINIINNAIDALLCNIKNKKIKMEVVQYGSNQHQISISNNGAMIPQEIQDKIFVPFFTTKNGGSGIGLSLVRQIVQLHGGYIFMKSNDQSTVFIITI